MHAVASRRCAERGSAGDIARALALALDPVQLARAADITPDPWQADLLRSEAKQLIMLASRQSGKSTVAALLAVWEALYRAPAFVLLLAPVLRQSIELFRKLKHVIGALPPETVGLVRETELTLELATGSRIVCLPGKEQTIRGFSAVSLLVVDEAARVPDDLYAAIRPMLAISKRRLVALSTGWESGAGSIRSTPTAGRIGTE